jgi:hypothetical protein
MKKRKDRAPSATKQAATPSLPPTLLAAVKRLVPESIFAGFPLHGNTDWTPMLLTMTGLLWAWSGEASLSDRFAEARQVAGSLTGAATPHSYQGFIAALKRWTDLLVFLLLEHVRERLPKVGRQLWRVGDWVPLAVDGTRCEAPRTKSNESLLAGRKAKRQKRKLRAIQPQFWITVLWHLRLRLPWDWRLGPVDTSERGHLAHMLDGLPQQSLLVGDAGFVSYDLWRNVLAGGHALLMRVGNNVRLLRKLGRVQEGDGCVFFWPQWAQGEKQPPLVLRLVTVRRKQSVWCLVTSILDRRQLSDRQVAELYGWRWGVEVFVRTFKQTYQRSKLRSHSGENAICELAWSLAGLLGVQLLSVEALLATGQCPARLSTAVALRAVRLTMRHPPDQPLPQGALGQRLSTALLDPYKRRSKKSRAYPRQKREQPPSPPQILTATATERRLAKPFLVNYLAI